MNETHGSTNDPLPIPLVEEIDRLCDSFTAAYHDKAEPRIEDYLKRLPAVARREGLRQLLAADLEARLADQRDVDVEQYHRRFPQDRDLVDEVMDATRAGDIDGSSAPTAGRIPMDAARQQAGEDADEPEEPIPKRIGRYVVEDVLGIGGFGRVYRARDPQLNRPVAIKGPSARYWDRLKGQLAERFQAEGAARIIGEFLQEARSAAGLKHPGLVGVHDFQVDQDRPYIVQELIDGCDLSEWAQQNSPDDQAIVKLVMEIAEALSHAHSKKFVHRDLKPANVLVDHEGHVHITDFGLALHESVQLKRVGEVSGTLPYMSPEQVRGETHRLDGRSDLWSLGVIFYELMVGQRPFQASRTELIVQIESNDPRPPRQRRPNIPAELERICLKCLEKRRSDRYSSAAALIDDLRNWLQSTLKGLHGPQGTHETASDDAHVNTLVNIVPKGLRSFDEHDADFFLQLLPGPRNRDGLPESVRFWKSRIEETDADSTFPVGLIYGPSGCGKSSLVRAGLLPRLQSHVCTVYVESTADDTEVRILKGLKKQFPDLPNADLPETLLKVRECGVGRGRKLLIVIDQFEQWLHSHAGEEATQLVDALRHCDGGNVQCIVIVRDDFWMAATRFMRALEVPLLENHNSAAVDLFDVDHARKVLIALGRAYTKLPELPAEPDEGQLRFLRSSIDGLASERKVICVQLAVFAEMMKGRPWTTASLREVGGTQGVGVTFLEETFAAKTAPPTHRLYQQPIRAVLKDLLPERGSDIKGRMISYEDLLEVSGCCDRPEDFQTLLNILDGELRLITPTEPDDLSAEHSASDAGQAARFYQLTHDFLVPSLREWLTRKLKETPRGRAELRLAERAQAWSASPEARQLPNWFEWLSAIWYTDSKSRTDAERAVVRASTAHHVRRMAAVAAALLVMLGTLALVRRHVERRADLQRADALLDRLRTGKVAHLRDTLKQIAVHQEILRPKLQAMRKQADLDQRWRAALALLPLDPEQAEFLQQVMCEPKLKPDEFLLIRDLLKDHGLDAASWAEQLLRDQPPLRFRAACALAGWDAQHPGLESQANAVVEELLDQPTALSAQWCQALYPARHSLIQRLVNAFKTLDQPIQISNCAQAMHAFSQGNTEILVSLLPAADDIQSRALTDTLLIANDPQTQQRIGRLVAQWKSAAPQAETDKDRASRAIANLAVALWVMGDDQELVNCLQYRDDPSLRTYTQVALSHLRVPLQGLIELLAKPVYNDSVQHGVLVALTDHLESLGAHQRDWIVRHTKDRFHTDPHPGIHSTCQLILTRLGEQQWIDEAQQSLDTTATTERGWSSTPWGHTLIHLRVGQRTVGLGCMEVSVKQFKQFDEDHQQRQLTQHGNTVPAVNLHIYECVRYCQWLSEQTLPEDQWCYPPLKELNRNNMRPADGYLDRSGYRLPTSDEWRTGCAAGATTERFYGRDAALLPRYAWDLTTSRGSLAPVGTLLPNRLGFFDTYGNAKEICATLVGNQLKFWSCGSSATSQPGSSESAARTPLLPNINNSNPYLGFRIARTLPAASAGAGPPEPRAFHGGSAATPELD